MDIWDKVVTDSGTTGYVARGDDDEDYIQVVGSNVSGKGFETSGSNLVCEPDVTVSNITSKLSGAVVKDAKGKKVTSGNIGTGYTIEYEGEKYTVVKLGDVNGDGKVNSGDTLALKQHVAKVKSITDSNYKKAADVNRDGKINSGDSLIAKQQVANVKDISL